MLRLIRLTVAVCCLQILVVPVYAGIIAITSKQELIDFGVFQTGDSGELEYNKEYQNFYDYSQEAFVFFVGDDQLIVSQNNPELFQEVYVALGTTIPDVHIENYPFGAVPVVDTADSMWHMAEQPSSPYGQVGHYPVMPGSQFYHMGSWGFPMELPPGWQPEMNMPGGEVPDLAAMSHFQIVAVIVPDIIPDNVPHSPDMNAFFGFQEQPANQEPPVYLDEVIDTGSGSGESVQENTGNPPEEIENDKPGVAQGQVQESVADNSKKLPDRDGQELEGSHSTTEAPLSLTLINENSVKDVEVTEATTNEPELIESNENGGFITVYEDIPVNDESEIDLNVVDNKKTTCALNGVSETNDKKQQQTSVLTSRKNGKAGTQQRKEEKPGNGDEKKQEDQLKGKTKEPEGKKRKVRESVKEKVSQKSTFAKARAAVLIGAKKVCCTPKKSRFSSARKWAKSMWSWVSGAFRKSSATRKTPRPVRALVKSSGSLNHQPSALRSTIKVIVLGILAVPPALYGAYKLYRKLVDYSDYLYDPDYCKSGITSVGFSSACEQLKEAHPIAAQWVAQAARELQYFPVFTEFSSHSERLPVSPAVRVKNKGSVFAAKGFYNLRKGEQHSQPSIRLNEKSLNRYLTETVQKIMKKLAPEQIQQNELNPLSQVLLWCGVSNGRSQAGAEKCIQWVIKQIKDSPDQPWYQTGIHRIYFEQFSAHSPYQADRHYLGVMPVYYLDVADLRQAMKYEPRALFIAPEALPSVNIPLNALAGVSLYPSFAEEMPQDAEVYRLSYGNTWAREPVGVYNDGYMALPQGEIFSFNRNGKGEARYFAVVDEDFLFSLDINRTNIPENHSVLSSALSSALSGRHWALHPYKRNEWTAYSEFPLHDSNKWKLERYTEYEQTVLGVSWLDALTFSFVMCYNIANADTGVRFSPGAMASYVILSATMVGFYRWVTDWNALLRKNSRWVDLDDLVKAYQKEGEQDKINLLTALVLDVNPFGVLKFSHDSDGYMVASSFLPMENIIYAKQKMWIDKAYKHCKEAFGRCNFNNLEHLEFLRFNLMLCSYSGYEGCPDMWKVAGVRESWLSYLTYIDWKSQKMRLDQEVNENQFKVDLNVEADNMQIMVIRYQLQGRGRESDRLYPKTKFVVKGELQCIPDKQDKIRHKCIRKDGFTYITFYADSHLRLTSFSKNKIMPRHLLVFRNGRLLIPYWKRQAAWQESHVMPLTEPVEKEGKKSSYVQQNATDKTETAFGKDSDNIGNDNIGSRDYAVEQSVDSYVEQTGPDFCNSLTFDQLRQLCLGENLSDDDKKYFEWINEYGVRFGSVLKYQLREVDVLGSIKTIIEYSGEYKFHLLTTDRLKVHLEQLRGSGKFLTQHISDILLSHAGYIERYQNEIDILVYNQVYAMAGVEYIVKPVSREFMGCNLSSIFRGSICGGSTRCLQTSPIFNMTDNKVTFKVIPVRDELNGHAEQEIEFYPQPEIVPCKKLINLSNMALQFSSMFDLSEQDRSGAIQKGERKHEFSLCLENTPFLARDISDHKYAGIFMLSQGELFIGGCDSPIILPLSP